jgi:hypothetical protein
MDKLLSMVQVDTPEIKKEVWWIFHNIFVHGNDEQVRIIVNGPALDVLREALHSDDSENIYLALESLDRLFKQSWDGSKLEPQLLDLLDQHDIIKALERLQEWPEPEIYDLAIGIIEKYLPHETDTLL